MLSLRAGSQRYCDGWRRREFLSLGSLAALGFSGAAGLAGPAHARAFSAGNGDGFGRAKRCLLLFLTGGPPQHDTFDPKPLAPAEIRGELAPIPTATPGVLVSELFPRLALLTDRFRIVRSLSHGDTVHTTAGYAVLTGVEHPKANQVASATMIRRAPDDRPHLTSVAYAALVRGRPQMIPPISLPELIKDANVNEFPGVDAGFLSKRFGPMLVEADTQRTGFLPPPSALPVDVPVERLRERVALREVLEQRLRGLESARPGREQEELFHQALSLLQSPRLRRAFDLDEEPAALRDEYGGHLFGQGTLLARRLLEAGATLVSVYWHYEGPDDSPVWDTHGNNFPHLRDRLAPPTDRAVAALLADLSRRGLLDETLVVCVGEFGRTPRINAQAGRDHWPQVQSFLLAGAGIPGGTVYGTSDANGAYPAQQPLSPQDLAATLLYLLGVPADHELTDYAGRPHRAALGEVVPALIT